jgi:predicted metal-dependent phosphoesterase TrpH
MTPRRLRADLHVHSYHSGYAAHLRFLRTRDCYSDPEAVYRTAKARGMDLVTITDHDSIGGCLEFLDRHPDADDFFISEEIECWLPNRLKVHVGAYDINERIHREVQRLRENACDVVAYLHAENVCCTLNHPFFFFRGQMPLEEYLRTALGLFTAFEVRNGAMLRVQNELATDLLSGRFGAPPRITARVGGSDSHTLRRVGTTYTETDGCTREDFLANLRAGATRVGGRHGATWDIAAEIYGVVGHYAQAVAGLRRHDLTIGRRLIGLGWLLASAPVQFTPLFVAVLQKMLEARLVARCRAELSGQVDGAGVLALEDLERP